MNKKIRPLLLLMLPALASCGGFSLDYIVKGNKYMSADFNENYYEHWDDELKTAEHAKTFTDTDTQFIEDFDDVGLIDQNLLLDNPYSDVEEYGKDYRLNKTNEIFNYGVQSKLFDGISYCRSRFQRVRVQSRKSGFSVRFSKESDELNYFAIHFKATTNNQIQAYKVGTNELGNKDQDYFHTSSFDLTISLYVKDNQNKIVAYDFKKNVLFDGVTNNGAELNYKFLAFNAKEIGTEQFTISRVVGFSVTFDNLNDELIKWNNENHPDIKISEDDYALFIYEVFMPYTYWH